MSLSEEDESPDILTILPWAIREFKATYRQCGDILKRRKQTKSERSKGGEGFKILLSDRAGENTVSIIYQELKKKGHKEYSSWWMSSIKKVAFSVSY